MLRFLTISKIIEIMMMINMVLSFSLKKMLESGQLSRIWKKWYSKQNKVLTICIFKEIPILLLLKKDCLETGAKALGSKTVGSIFYILGFAGLLSGFILILEIIIK